MSRVAALALAVAALGACTPSTPSREDRAAPVTKREQHAAAPDAPAAAPKPAPKGPPPAVTIVAEVGEHGVVPVVQNHDPEPVRLSTVLRVEHQRDEGFTAFADEGLGLRDACNAPAPDCVALVPGAELRPPAWRAPEGHAQCGDAPTPKATPGRYRFVLRACDDGPRIEGAPFAID